MRVPVDWLKEYVDFDLPVEKLAEKLTLSGSEVDEIHKAAEFKNIVVGEILEIQKHPNADKLHICQIDVGEKKPRQIICGSLFTVNVGDKVPVALAPTKVGDLKIEKSKLRGVESYGMICSDQELGIEDSGLTFFDKKTKNGTDINKIFGGEAVLDIDLTPNRTDCYSMVGMARETAAILDKKSKIIEPKAVKTDSNQKIKVEVKEKGLCKRYVSKVIEGVTIAPSPDWMQKRLIAAGVRPINNIVDVTNYVMLEWGQPLHAFDLNKISGNKIIVQRAKDGERMETLDDVLRTFNSKDFLIADDKEPIAAAGVMGGASSEVSNKTKNIVLEAANFDAISIRKTAQRLKLRSESSSRFEKGLPLKLQIIAIERAAELILEIAGGNAGPNVDIYSQKEATKSVKMSISRLEKFVGIKIPEEKINSILKSLGFELAKSGDIITAKVPWWRLDISIPEDLYEEIARIYGYDNMPSTLPEGELPSPEENKKLEMISKIKGTLFGAGFTEVINYSFTSKKTLDFLGNTEKALKISNPISPEWEYMRTEIVSSLLQNVKINEDGYEKIRIFEVGNVYIKSEVSVEEKNIFAIALNSKNKNGEGFFLLKGVLELLFDKLNVGKLNLKAENLNLLEDGRSASISTGRENIGVMGKVSEETKRFFGIKDNVYVAQIDINSLLKDYSNIKKYQEFSRFPTAERDLTFIFEEETKVLEIEQNISSLPSKIRVKSQIMDVYRGQGLEKNEKAVTVRFTYQSSERTLEEKEIEDDQKKIIKDIESKLGGKLRGETS